MATSTRFIVKWQARSLKLSEKPIAYASRNLLSKAEKNYAQIQKEAPAIVYGIQKFLHCRPTWEKIQSHYRPQILIDNMSHPTKGIPETAVSRLQRWTTIFYLHNYYDYVVQYKPTANHDNADGLSRLSHLMLLHKMMSQRIYRCHLCN